MTADSRPGASKTVLVSMGMTVLIGVGLYQWALRDPVRVLVGSQGRHDAPPHRPQPAACLDCHVPFLGTPTSRCLAPGCHASLVTGTPPKTGPAMPVRFHSVLRDLSCQSCHGEHQRGISLVPFRHQIIPTPQEQACFRCHSGARRPKHARTDAIACGTCHSTDNWAGTKMSHEKVTNAPCALCHRPPDIAGHPANDGCIECHETNRWAQEEK